MRSHRVYVLLPAYNEAAVIEPLVRKLVSELSGHYRDFRIIVCDDGSSDETGAILNRLKETCPVDVITHPLNRGLGETVRDLFERAAALTDDDDVVVRLDCDDTHDPAYVAKLVHKLEEGFDVAIASRFRTGGGQVGLSGYRTVVSLAANLFMKLFFPIPGVREYTCAYRAYRGRLIRRAIDAYGNNFVQLRGLGFTASLEKLVKLKMLGARFAEVPFVLRYDKKRSSSKMVTSITTFGYFVLVILYYWPWGGWRRGYRRLQATTHESGRAASSLGR